MVEGGGSRDFAEVRRMACRHPAVFSRLMEILTEATYAYLAASGRLCRLQGFTAVVAYGGQHVVQSKHRVHKAVRAA
jgi:hypothetical protein